MTNKTKSVWTERKTSSLLRWYETYKDGEKTFYKISRRLKGVSPDACYKKLGRLGAINAPWANNYQK